MVCCVFVARMSSIALVDGAGDAVFTFLMILDGVILHLEICANNVLISTQIDSFYLMINQQNNKFDWSILEMFCKQSSHFSLAPFSSTQEIFIFTELQNDI